MEIWPTVRTTIPTELPRWETGRWDLYRSWQLHTIEERLKLLDTDMDASDEDQTDLEERQDDLRQRLEALSPWKLYPKKKEYNK